ncbi:MAG: DUF3943 domain-containing protein [Candidatus Binatia bacterium]
MAQIDATLASTPTAGNSISAQQCGKSLFSLVLIMILLPCAAFAQSFGALAIPAAGAESERSALTSLAHKAGFTLSSNAARIDPLINRTSLLAQTANAPSPATGNINLATSVPAWGTQKSYLIPALEIVGFDVLLNLFDRAYYGCCDFDSDFSSISRNLRRGWKVDSDEFTVNQLGHPYQGSMYHGFARASGLNYWQGLAYTLVGSLFWE